MSEDLSTASSAGGSQGPARVLASRPLRLWAALVCGLLVAFAADSPVMSRVEALQHSTLAGVLSNTVRWLGNGRFQIPALLLLMVAGALLSRRLLRAAWLAFVAFVASGITANLMKVLIHRARPFTSAPQPEQWLGYLRAHDFQSFPSGDSTTTFAIAAVLGAAFPRAQAPLMAVAIIVAAARVLVGSHHPSDVVAGAMLGLAVAHIVLRLARRRDGAGAHRASGEPES